MSSSQVSRGDRLENRPKCEEVLCWYEAIKMGKTTGKQHELPFLHLAFS